MRKSPLAGAQAPGLNSTTSGAMGTATSPWNYEGFQKPPRVVQVSGGWTSMSLDGFVELMERLEELQFIDRFLGNPVSSVMKEWGRFLMQPETGKWSAIAGLDFHGGLKIRLKLGRATPFSRKNWLRMILQRKALRRVVLLRVALMEWSRNSKHCQAMEVSSR